MYVRLMSPVKGSMGGVAQEQGVLEHLLAGGGSPPQEREGRLEHSRAIVLYEIM